MSWLPPGRERSGNSIPRVPGRCCAVTPMPGFQRPNVAAAETSRRGSRAAGGGWCRCGGITARSVWTAGCCRFRWRGAARRCGSAWTATCPTRRPDPFGHLAVRRGPVWVDVTAEVPVAPTRRGRSQTRAGWPGWTWASSTRTRSPGRTRRVAGVGRAIRAEHHLHHADAKARSRAAARGRRSRVSGGRGAGAGTAAASGGQRRGTAAGSARPSTKPPPWSSTGQSQRRVGTLAVGDPRGVLSLAAGRRHNRRVRDWRVGRLIRVLADKAEQAGITVTLVDERGSSSTCPKCYKRVPKPSGRVFTCPHCRFTGHRDLVAGVHIAARCGGGITSVIVPADVTHRRAGAHLPGVSRVPA